MRVLLDTHVIVWALTDDIRLTDEARDIITDRNNDIFYSTVSVWEIMLKCNSKKNNLMIDPSELISGCNVTGFVELNLKNEHVIAAMDLDTENAEALHKDPFDRIILAQARSEGLYLLTHDSKMSLYNENCVILF
ncbi:MAG: type II toxin-antitoxin system VapC family toxin [Oscillospiraceae bacterium]|nr:type II toxin-antitoxin system VapC family toxin [Oscillospiraceae bacterium]